MATTPAVRKEASVPQFGTIEGGLLYGWSFTHEVRPLFEEARELAKTGKQL